METIFKCVEKYAQRAINEEDEDVKKSIEKKATQFYKLCDKLRDTSYVNSVMKEADNDFYDSSQEFFNNLNEKHNLICFNNGVFDLSKTNTNFLTVRP